MKTVAVIQARMGSTRLPGKVMLPLAGKHVLTRDVERVAAAETIDETVVATSEQKQDDIVARYAERAGASVFRGSETDVLQRMFRAAARANPDIVVRITGDCPLVSPTVIDATVERIREASIEYASTTVERTFPRGVGAEAFTFDSFETVEAESTESHEREHVTPYYFEVPGRFDIAHVTSDEVFEKTRYRDRTDLRLTLDETDDYELLREVYDGLQQGSDIDIRDAIDYIDERNLADMNADVEQKSHATVDGSGS